MQTSYLNKKILISTLPRRGGVGTKSKWLIKVLKKNGLSPIIAYYQPYSIDPKLSVPFSQLFRRKISHTELSLDGDPCYQIGAYFPEFELTHYWNTKVWSRLMDKADYHVAITGNILAGFPFWQMKLPHLIWAASPYSEDRKERVKTFPWYRKVFDQMFNLPVSLVAERTMLKDSHVLSVSQYTEREFKKRGLVSGAIMPVPIETDIFKPDFSLLRPWRIGIVARLDDARKNLPLLIEAIHLLKKQDQNFELVMVGGKPSATDEALLQALDLGDRLLRYDFLSQAELIQLLQTLDVFVVSSWQEGLCIAGLEAMAVGCPVIATRCGGPEDYVISGQNGYLIDFNSQELADSISTLCSDRALRKRFSEAAYEMVRSRYSEVVAEEIFWNNFEKVFAGSC